MIPGRIQGANAVLGAPEGWEKLTDLPCGALPIRAEVISGVPILRSAWLPTPDELARLNAGAAVILGVGDVSHPPVSVEVGEPPE